MNTKHALQTVIAFAIAAICTTGYAQNNSVSQTDESVIVSDMSEFSDADSALHRYIADNLKYPEEAKSKGLKGKVFVSFVVSETGDIENVKVSRGLDPLLDKEAIRVVQSIPKEILPKTVQHGKPVRMAYTVAVIFPLEKEK